MSDDWYRRKTWTEADQTEFNERLSRSRGQYNKAQYLRIQASYLEDKYPAASLELMNRIVTDFPEPCELAQTYLQMAHCYSVLSDTDNAVRCFRKALVQEVEYPKSRTQTYLDFPVFALVNNLTELYEEVTTVLVQHQSWILFPVDRYMWNMCLALIADYNGDIEAARNHASAALQAADEQQSGFRYHPKVGLVKKQDKMIMKKLISFSTAP